MTETRRNPIRRFLGATLLLGFLTSLSNAQAAPPGIAGAPQRAGPPALGETARPQTQSPQRSPARTSTAIRSAAGGRTQATRNRVQVQSAGGRMGRPSTALTNAAGGAAPAERGKPGALGFTPDPKTPDNASAQARRGPPKTGLQTHRADVGLARVHADVGLQRPGPTGQGGAGREPPPLGSPERAEFDRTAGRVGGPQGGPLGPAAPGSPPQPARPPPGVTPGAAPPPQLPPQEALPPGVL